MAFVTKGIRLTFKDEREDPEREHTFYFEGGVTSFVRYLNRTRKALHDPVYIEKEVDNIGIEVAIQYATPTPKACTPLPTPSIPRMAEPI
jgi:DNA gyrase subunit B